MQCLVQITESIEVALRSHYEEDPLDASIHMIYTLNKEPLRKLGLETLQKYLTNLMDNPNDQKYRRIRTTNKVFMVCRQNLLRVCSTHIYIISGEDNSR